MSLPWAIVYAGPAAQAVSPRISETRAEESAPSEERGAGENLVTSAAGGADELLIIEDLAGDRATGIEGLLASLIAHDRPILILAERGPRVLGALDPVIEGSSPDCSWCSEALCSP